MNLTLKATSEIAVRSDGSYICVSAVCVERPDLSVRFGMSVGMNTTLRDRLMRAVDAGAAFTDVTIQKDVDEQEYISFKCNVLGRYLNADLRRLGF